MTRATRPSTSPARAYRSSAAPEPKTLCPLLVPSASAGGSPAASRAGSVMRPPPPAMASTVPATKEATTRSASAGRETSKRGGIYQQWMAWIDRLRQPSDLAAGAAAATSGPP